jgi:hypothetical protein
LFQRAIRIILKLHPDDVDGVQLRNAGLYNLSDVAACPRKIYRDFYTRLFASDLELPQ